MVRFPVPAARPGPDPNIGTRAAAAADKPTANLRMPPPGVERDSSQFWRNENFDPLAQLSCPGSGLGGQRRDGRGDQRRLERVRASRVGRLFQESSQAASSTLGRGRLRWKPWATPQPILDRRERVAWSSTPSATTRRPRLAPRSTTERTMATSLLSRAMPLTKDLSILTSLTGRRLR